MIVCMKSSSKDKVCPKRKCHFLHLVTLEKITKGLPAMCQWIKNTAKVAWATKELVAEAAKAKGSDESSKTKL